MTEKKSNSFNSASFVIVVLLMVISFLGGSIFTKIRSADKAEPDEKEEAIAPTVAPLVAKDVLSATVGNFSTIGEEVCEENGLPIIYYFGSSSCPHCTWEHPVFEEVAEKFDGLIALHDNMDNQVDMDIFRQYNDRGSIPFLLFGCRYMRLGSGERSGEIEEKKNLTALICKLTDNQPAEVCAGVEDLVAEIEK